MGEPGIVPPKVISSSAFGSTFGSALGLAGVLDFAAVFAFLFGVSSVRSVTLRRKGRWISTSEQIFVLRKPLDQHL